MVPTPTQEERTEQYLRRGAVLSGIVAAVIGAVHLALWLFGLLTSSGLYSFVMKTNASLCLALSGLALAAAAAERTRPRQWWAAGLAGPATAIGALTLLEHLLGFDFGIDQFLAYEEPGALGVLHPNRMGPPGAFAFTICGIGTFLLLQGKGLAIRVAQSFGLVLCLLGLMGLLGYLYHVEGFYAAPRVTAIALPTSFSIFLLGVGLLLARPREAFTAVFTAPTPGGFVSRALLLPAVALPILLGWLVLAGEFHGLYGTTFSISLLVLSWIVTFSAIVYEIGKRADLHVRLVEDQRTREALLQSEEKLRDIIDNMAEGLIVIDAETAGLYWNRRALEMYDFEEELDAIKTFELTAQKIELRTLDGELLPLEQWPIRRVMRGEELHDVELLVKNMEQTWQRIYSYRGAAIRDPQGKLQMGVLTLRDITVKRHAQEALRESEELLSAVLETLPVGVWVLAANGSILHANRAAEEIWGGAPRVGIDQYQRFKGWRVDTGEPIAAREWGGARAISKGEITLNEEVEIEAFDGSRKIILLSAVPIRDDKGEITGAVAVNQDITVRKRIETALRVSEEKFRAVFEQAAVGMGRVTFDDARWIDVNEAFCNMLGYRREEMLATPWPEMTHPDDLDLDLIPFRKMAAGELDSYSVEKRFLHKNGRHVWARLTLSLVRDLRGGPDFEVAIVEDIARRKEAEEALRRAKDELELRVRERTAELEQAYVALQRETDQRLAAVEDLREKEQLLMRQSRLAAMGEMLGNIAHQWRQPLNVLGLLVQQLQLTYEVGQFSGEFLKGEVAKVMDLIRHMSDTITDFKDFLKEEKEPQPFNVNAAVAATVTLLEAPLKAMRVEVRIEQTDELVVTGHRNEFSHVIMNLVNNAREALNERAVAAPRISIRLFKDAGRSVVTVTDNAGGIAEEIMPRMFEPYFTTKGPDKGTGIGLYMSKNIIEKSMGGRLYVRNTVEGAEFRIEFSG
jgi:PAS domain S-box-containing protein